MPPTTDSSFSPAVEPAVAIRLVLGVARLGEADLAGWWSSQGLNPAVRFALAGFRRTGQVVGAQLALLSAERRHRQLLARANAIHLFSPNLPYLGWAQAELAEMKSAGPSGLLDELASWSSVEQAVTALRSSLPAGSTDEAATSAPRFLASMAEHYLAPATAGRQLSADDIDHVEMADKE
ncbi:MAG: BrxE family protein [Acidimicrobiales bacterium]